MRPTELQRDIGDDEVFRSVLIVGSFIVFLIMAYHRFKSQATRERLDRRQEGLYILLTLRPIGVAAMLGLIAYMVNPSWMAAMPVPERLRWMGVGLFVLAGAVLI